MDLSGENNTAVISGTLDYVEVIHVKEFKYHDRLCSIN